MTVMERDTELALVDRLRDGDPAAFDAVYEAYRARVFSFLARLARSREVAEDLAEDTWLRLVETAPRLRPDTRLGPWLFTVARNLYYSYCRSRAISDAAADALISLWPGGSSRPSPSRKPLRANSGAASSGRWPGCLRITARRCCLSASSA